MSLTVAKQLELERKKREEIQRKEAEWLEKTEQLKEWRKERDEQELRDLDERRQSLDDRLTRSQNLHMSHLRRIATEAKLKNVRDMDKTMTFRKHMEIKEDLQHKEQEKEDRMRKKALRAIYNEKVELFEALKEEKRKKQSVVEVKKLENHKEQL